MSTAGQIGAGLARNPVVGGVLAVVVVGGFVWWKWGDELKRFFRETKDKFNPTSDKNLAYTGVNSVGQAVTGDEHWSLGGAIYDILHPYDPNAPAKLNNLIAPSDVDGRPSSLR